MAFQGVEEIAAEDFTLLINGKLVQRGNTSDMIFSLQQILDYVGEHYGLDEGDHIFTGTPAGVGAIYKGDKLELSYGSKLLGSCEIMSGPACS
ncbi:Fumarylpyruvate hydrolase [compost metagenome]